MKKPEMLLAIGASAGGSTVFPALLKQITSDLPLAVMIVLHLSETTIADLMVSRLQKFTSFVCKVASDGEKLQQGHVYFAAPNQHMLIKENRILLGAGARENRYRPSIDALFRSVAVAFGPKAIGIVLSGMLEDGSAGMYAILQAGGICIVQDPSDALYPDMPEAVINLLKPDYCVPVSRMGDSIRESVTRLEKRKTGKIPDQIRREAQISESVSLGVQQMEELGTIAPVTCPDCGGNLWTITENGMERYRCHVAHSFSERSLIDNMETSTESTLWVALRMVEERINLLRKIGKRESQKSKSKLAETYFDKANELQAHAERLKALLFSIKKPEMPSASASAGLP